MGLHVGFKPISRSIENHIFGVLYLRVEMERSLRNYCDSENKRSHENVGISAPFFLEFANLADETLVCEFG